MLEYLNWTTKRILKETLNILFQIQFDILKLKQVERWQNLRIVIFKQISFVFKSLFIKLILGVGTHNDLKL